MRTWVSVSSTKRIAQRTKLRKDDGEARLWESFLRKDLLDHELMTWQYDGAICESCDGITSAEVESMRLAYRDRAMKPTSPTTLL